MAILVETVSVYICIRDDLKVDRMKIVGFERAPMACTNPIK
jgi:hypothetical protein